MLKSSYKNCLRYTGLLAVIQIVTGCVGPTGRYFEDKISANADRTVEALAGIRREQPKPAYAVEDQKVVVTSRSISLSKDTLLPDTIQHVTFRFPGRVSLPTMVERISRETGMPIVLTPDALLSPASFFP